MKDEKIIGVLILLGYIKDRPKACKEYIVRKYYHTKWWYLEKFHGKRKLRVDD